MSIISAIRDLNASKYKIQQEYPPVLGFPIFFSKFTYKTSSVTGLTYFSPCLLNAFTSDFSISLHNEW